MARPSKYDKYIKPNLDTIKEQLMLGVAENRIAEKLGVAYSTWRKYKAEIDEFSAIFDDIEVVTRIEVLENKMFELAQGFKTTVVKGMKVKDSDGSEHVEQYEETVFVPPNFNALRFLLTNWSDHYSNDPALMRQREKEFEHKKQMDESNAW